MSILPMSLSIPVTPQSLASSKAFSTGSISTQPFPLTAKLSKLSLTTPAFRTTPIRMGGGPRTFPGGVSKWQWKKMQAKKAKQLLQARLTRERQIYEMRKRAELKAAVSELERPWETVEKPPNLFSVGADEQLKVLADRFQKPGGFDMWSEKDGPELFRPDDGLPSSRFFPKGVVHSAYRNRKLAAFPEELQVVDGEEVSGQDPVIETGLVRKSGNSRRRSRSDKEGEGGSYNNGKLSQKGNRGSYLSGSARLDSGNYNQSNPRRGGTNGELWRRKTSHEKGKNVNTEVVDMSFLDEGIYGFE